METLILLEDELDKAKELLINEQVIAFPTETVYGLGVISDSYVAFKKMVGSEK